MAPRGKYTACLREISKNQTAGRLLQNFLQITTVIDVYFDHLHSTLLRVFSSAVLGGEINPSNARSSLNNLAPLHLLPSHWTAMANARPWRL